jgi:hypothetical protein
MLAFSNKKTILNILCEGFSLCQKVGENLRFSFRGNSGDISCKPQRNMAFYNREAEENYFNDYV